MFIRPHKRFKNGKWHTYYSVVENRRCTNGQHVQRQVLYLGEISSSQEDAWQQALDKFNPTCQRDETLDLFASPRTLSTAKVRTLSLRQDVMRLRRPRTFGSCWLGCRLWSLLELDRFWDLRLAYDGRSGVAWQKVLQLLVVNRLVDPGSEFRLHRQWFTRSAMDELLQVDKAVAAKDRLYRCLDRILPYRQELFVHLQQRWKDLFSVSFDILLYDLTSTYFEGLCEQIPMAKHGYSRDGRPDCRQVVIALVVTPDGLPLAYEVMPGNTSDRTTLEGFLRKIEQLYGKARRTWVMDRGIPTEQTLSAMRARGIDYLVGTPKGRLSAMEQKLLDKPWQKVQQGIEVKLSQEPDELWVLARSKGRRDKEAAMRRQKLRKFFQGLLALRRSCPKRDALLQRLGALKHQAGRAANLVEIQLPKPREVVTPQTFRYRLKLEKFKQVERLDGHYLLRTSLHDQPPELLWQSYTQLTHIEEAFKNLKSDLKIRPIYHKLEPRMEAHILVAFMAYCLTATLTMQTRQHAPGLTARAVLEQLAAIQMIDVHIPTTDGRCLVLPRYTEPESEQAFLLEKLKLTLPEQPPPKIYASELAALQEHLEPPEPRN